jgi:transcriptional regulator with XRE-family HTH domain
MSVISEQFAEELKDKEMRDAYLDEKMRAKVALQIKALRTQRGWSQAELGQRIGKPQSNVARLEDRDVARYTLTTLLELASTYDCGLVVEFVPYAEFLERTHDLSPTHLQVPSFTPASLLPLCQDLATERQGGADASTGSLAPSQHQSLVQRKTFNALRAPVAVQGYFLSGTAVRRFGGGPIVPSGIEGGYNTDFDLPIYVLGASGSTSAVIPSAAPPPSSLIAGGANLRDQQIGDPIELGVTVGVTVGTQERDAIVVGAQGQPPELAAPAIAPWEGISQQQSDRATRAGP